MLVIPRGNMKPKLKGAFIIMFWIMLLAIEIFVVGSVLTFILIEDAFNWESGIPSIVAFIAAVFLIGFSINKIINKITNV